MLKFNCELRNGQTIIKMVVAGRLIMKPVGPKAFNDVIDLCNFMRVTKINLVGQIPKEYLTSELISIFGNLNLEERIDEVQYFFVSELSDLFKA